MHKNYLLKRKSSNLDKDNLKNLPSYQRIKRSLKKTTNRIL